MLRSWAKWLLFAVCTIFCACGEQAATAPEQAPPRPVKTFEVGTALGSISREWPGRIEPTQNAEMSFNVAGDIVALPVSEGMSVNKGDVLAKLDPRQLRARLDAEVAQRRFQEVEYQRSSTLVQRGAVGSAELDSRERSLAMSRAKVDEAKKALADTTMRAPFAGTIAKVMGNNFQSVQAKQVILVLQDASSLEIVTHLSQRDYAAATPNLTIAERNEKLDGRVHVVIDTLPDLRIPAALKEVATVPDAITGTYEVTWSFDPPAEVNITAGMTAKLMLDPEFVSEQAQPTLLVPVEAVVGSDDGTTMVWKIDPSSMAVSAVPVQTGEFSGGSVEILSPAEGQPGIAGGDLIATTGVHALREGMVVTRYEDIYGNVQRAR